LLFNESTQTEQLTSTFFAAKKKRVLGKKQKAFKNEKPKDKYRVATSGS